MAQASGQIRKRLEAVRSFIHGWDNRASGGCHKITKDLTVCRMDTLTKSERSIRMGRIRSKDTKPELAVRRLVHGMGYRFRLHDKYLPGHPDMVFRSRSKVIFVHGCFWHLHKNCSNCRPPKSRKDYWMPKLEQNAERDQRVLRQLRRLGWRCMAIWECELANPDRLARKMGHFLES